jgi:16S rRNA (cytosine967-C5)-methyltransferase
MPVDHRDRRFIFEIAYGVVRRRFTIDHIIKGYIEDKRLVSNYPLKRILELGIYQILYLDRVPDHAAVNESVDLAKHDAQTRPFSGLVNALLRKVITNRRQLPVLPDAQKDLAERLSVEYSHPRWLITRWLTEFGLSNTKKLLAFNNEIPPVFLRRKVRGISRQVFETEAKPICEGVGGYLSLYYRLTAQIPVDSIALLQRGICTVQAPASGWVVALLELAPGDKCIDLCSAPGGKTALASELVSREGEVYATDLKASRMSRLVENRERMGLDNVHVFVSDSTKPPVKVRFGHVLVDVPCSGTGVMHRHPEARWTRQEQDIEQVTALQKALLDAATGLVAPGGILVYSTCSLEPQENWAVVEDMLKRRPEFVLERPPASIPDQFVGLDGCLHITPFEHGMDGVFGARLRRRA